MQYIAVILILREHVTNFGKPREIQEEPEGFYETFGGGAEEG